MPDRLQDWIKRHDSHDKPLIPASTVLLVRDSPDGLETLLMRRNTQLSFAEGMWVFPGGRIDDADHPTSGPDEPAAARNAAVREAREEADLVIDERTLVHYSHWIPPVQAPKRFSTWFFLAPAPRGTVTVDQGEILEHAWCRPVDALERAHDRRIEILPPTWVSLHDMAQHHTVDELFAAVGARGPQTYATRMLPTDAGVTAIWERDASYETGDADTPGPRHRLTMCEGEWILEHN